VSCHLGLMKPITWGVRGRCGMHRMSVVVTFHRHIIISCSCSFLHGEDNEGFSVIVFLTSHGLDAGSRSQDSCGKCLRKRMISATYIVDIHSYGWRYLKDLHAFHPLTRLLNNPQPIPFAHASLRLSDTRMGHLFLALPWSF